LFPVFVIFLFLLSNIFIWSSLWSLSKLLLASYVSQQGYKDNRRCEYVADLCSGTLFFLTN
jgi:hypothetical protein